jgi:maleamate amidohydrolase
LPDLNFNKLGLGKSIALIVVDMTKGFIDPNSPLGFECNDLIESNQRIINAFREKELPIFFTTTIYSKDSEATIFRKKIPDLNILSKDSEWVEFTTKIKPKSSEFIIEKKHASAFFNTNLCSELMLKGVDTVAITGVTTSGCVRATAVDGLQNNFITIVVEDCVGDRNLNSHEANLHDLNAKYADIVSSRNLILEIEKSN